MIISIASGKGGTGKTTLAVNLAKSIGKQVQLLDCDVEEPNSHIFLDPVIRDKKTVHLPIPKVDLDRCTFCGKCSEICQFNAIATVKNNVLVFPELCHSCAGCWLICPQQCISQNMREIGYMESGSSDHIEFIHGRLNVGEVMSPPLIREVKKQINTAHELVIIDAPPGSSCPVIEAIKDSDFVILATEPTPFGLNDLKLAVEMVRKLRMPFGVVINRSDVGDDKVTQYCGQEKIPILMEIPNDRKIAEAYSIGKSIIDIYPEYRERFRKMLNEIEGRVAA